MSNMMPFILSSPPPIDDNDNEEEEDDEFGDFRVAEHTFVLTDCNQTNDSPDHSKSWEEPRNIGIEDDLSISETPLPEEIPLEGEAGNWKDEKEQLPVELLEKLPTTSDFNGCNSNPLHSNEEENEFNFSEETYKHSTQWDSVEEAGRSLEKLDLISQPAIVQKHDEKKAENSIDLLPDEEIESVRNSSEEEISSINNAQGCAININVDFDQTRTKEFNMESVNSKTSRDFYEFNNCESEVSGDDFNEFTDFTTGCARNENVFVKNLQKSEVLEPQVSNQPQDLQDDFSDFEGVQFESFAPIKEPTIEETLKLMFEGFQGDSQTDSEASEAGLMDVLRSALDEGKSVWGHLKELETSHALSYQWSNSTANKTLLSSLNIDCRNILFGAKWNSCVPRFAANLGEDPLEPVRTSEIPTSFPESSQPEMESIAEDSVPAAQFDWTNSGLTNPLDGLEKENGSNPEEGNMSGVLNSIGMEPLKPLAEDIFDSVLVSNSEENQNENPSASTPPILPSSAFAREKSADEIKAEAFATIESFPDLSFLSARKLMRAANENLNRWKVKP